MTTKQLLIFQPNTVISVSSTVIGYRLKSAVAENFPGFHGYIELKGDVLKLWEAGRAVAHSEGLTDENYIDCFYTWFEAVTMEGLEIESTTEFHEMLDESIKDFARFNLDV